MTSKKSAVLVFLLTLAFQSLIGFAGIPKPETFTPKGLDLLQEELKALKTPKNFKTIKRAYDLLKQEKYGSAHKELGPLKKDRALGDYALWISSSAHLGLARSAVVKRQFSQGIQSAKAAIHDTLQIEAEFPYSPFIKGISKDLAKAEVLIGDAYIGQKKWTLSQEYFERAFHRLTLQNSLIHLQIGSLSKYAEACRKKESDSCIQWLQKFSATLPKKSMEMRAILTQFPNIPEKLRVSRNAPRATISYKSPDLDQVAYDNAFKAFSSEKYGDSIKAFEQFLDEFPRSGLRFRARYWLGQAFIRKKDPEKGIKIYDSLLNESPLTYYGLLASIESQRSVETQIQASAPLAAESDPSLNTQDQGRLKRARHFLSERAYALAAIELREIKVQDSLSNPFLLYLAMLNYQAKNFRNSFSILGELIQRGYEGVLTSYGLQMIFPEQNFQTIQDYAKKTGLDPILVLSLIKQESAFEEEVLSSAGATGLMQLMPATAADVDSEVSLTDLRQPENNGYNAGPNAVDRWLKDFPAEKSMYDFIESIPYKETREYVAAIIRNYYWYSKKLNSANRDVKIDIFWKPFPNEKRRTPATADNGPFKTEQTETKFSPEDSQP
ncbi:MAG: transglycosylase SLT domain-containing protein [Bdellovibrio sp.]|nr:transglycosylase SLT domain-containing protein [Bdellovibrio sp.]